MARNFSALTEKKHLRHAHCHAPAHAQQHTAEKAGQAQKKTASSFFHRTFRPQLIINNWRLMNNTRQGFSVVLL
jgi:hypothetical protein